MSITDFKNALSGGGARSNRFEVVIDFPGFAAESETIRKTPFLAFSSQLPGSTIGEIEQMYRGRALYLAGDRTMEEFPITFLNDVDFGVRDAFERWHNVINNVNNNRGLSRPDDYFSTISVYQLDSDDNRVKEYNLKLAWPTTVGSIELSQDSNDTIETFEVTLRYSDFTTNTTVA